MNALCRTRTYDPLIKSQQGDSASGDPAKTCDGDPATPNSSHDSSSGNPPLDDDLRRVVEAWPTLPDPVRAGILAMIEATAGA